MARKPYTLTEEGRKRIIEGQKKRWERENAEPILVSELGKDQQNSGQ